MTLAAYQGPPAVVEHRGTRHRDAAERYVARARAEQRAWLLEEIAADLVDLDRHAREIEEKLSRARRPRTIWRRTGTVLGIE